MKIGFVVDNELINDKRVLREIDILKESGYEIFVLCFGFDKKIYPPVDGISVTRIRINRKIKNTLFFFLNLVPVYEILWSSAIKNFIKGNDLAALHTHDLYMSKAGHKGIKGSGKKIPMVLDLHENYPYAVTTYNWTRGILRNLLSQPQKWQKKEREYLGYADRIIVLSDEFRDTLNQRYPEISREKFVSLPNVPDLSRMTQKEPVTVKVDIKKGNILIFYFGVVAERRGIFDVLDVFNQLVNEGHASVFLIVGPVDKKDSRRFFDMINSEPLSKRLHYLPWIDLKELPAYLEIADICIAPFHKNPQHESGVANKIFDYMLGKKPVIASDCGPQKRLIEKYNCGIIYTSKDELKSAIIKLSDDPQLRIKMGENGFRAIIEEFNTEKKKDVLINLYRSIIT